MLAVALNLYVVDSNQKKEIFWETYIRVASQYNDASRVEMAGVQVLGNMVQSNADVRYLA